MKPRQSWEATYLSYPAREGAEKRRAGLYAVGRVGTTLTKPSAFRSDTVNAMVSRNLRKTWEAVRQLTIYRIVPLSSQRLSNAQARQAAYAERCGMLIREVALATVAGTNPRQTIGKTIPGFVVESRTSRTAVLNRAKTQRIPRLPRPALGKVLEVSVSLPYPIDWSGSSQRFHE